MRRSGGPADFPSSHLVNVQAWDSQASQRRSNSCAQLAGSVGYILLQSGRCRIEPMLVRHMDSMFAHIAFIHYRNTFIAIQEEIEMTNSRLTLSISAFAASFLVAGCAGLQTSSHSYSASYKANQPVKAEGCYDASVLLTKNIRESADISAKVLAAVDSTVSERTEFQIKAQRNRQIGLFVGSGGEELTIGLKASPGGTFVTVATKTGFVGGAGQKAWSCQIVDQIVAMASK
jgi:hypothetical protein